MQVVIRKIESADAQAISQLSGQLGYAFSVEDTTHQIDAINTSANDIAYVAVIDNVIVGWIHAFYTILLECPSCCEIGGLVVHEAYRGKGIGKMLIDSIIPWCKTKHCNVLQVHSNVKRAAAHKFYVQYGFKQIKEQKVLCLQLQ